MLWASPQDELCLLTYWFRRATKISGSPSQQAPGDCVCTLGELRCRYKGDLWKGTCGQSPGQGVGDSPHRGKMMGSLPLWRALVNCHEHTPVLRRSPSSDPPSSKQHTGACTSSQGRGGCRGAGGGGRARARCGHCPGYSPLLLCFGARIPVGH